MLKLFFSVLIHDLVSFVKKHKDFFILSDADKKEALHSLHIPSEIKEAFFHMNEKDFFHDMSKLMEGIQNENFSELSLKSSKLFKGISNFFIKNFAEAMQRIGSNFFLLPKLEREKQSMEIFPQKTLMASALRDLISSYSIQELSEVFDSLAKAVSVNASSILVQIPCEMSMEFTQQIREFFLSKEAESFPLITVQKNLIGGMRVFKNGIVQDLSWFASLQKLKSLTF